MTRLTYIHAKNDIPDEVLHSFSHPAYLHYPNRPGLAQFVAERVHETISQERNFGITLSLDSKHVGVIWAYHAMWESEILGVPMAKADILVDQANGVSSPVAAECLQILKEWAAKSDIRHLAVRLNLEDRAIRIALENAEFHIVDVLLVQQLTISRSAVSRQATVTCRPAVPQDAATFEQDVSGLYRLSRYNADGGFDSNRLKYLYQNWLKSDFDTWANHVIVAELGGRAAGFITCHLEERYAVCTGLALGFIGLLGVLPFAQGRGVGKSLVDSATKWFTERDVEVVTVATQITNYPGLSTYQSCDFKPLTSLATYHHWRIAQRNVDYSEVKE